MTWLDLPADHPFGVHNLPYGVFSTGGDAPRVGVRVGDHVLDLAACAEHAGMESAVVWRGASLNAFLEEGREAWTAARDVAHRAADQRGAPGCRAAAPRAARRGRDAPAGRGRGLRRLLRERAPREQRRAPLPPRLRAAHAELEAPADRLPRPLRHRRRVGHRRRAPEGAAQAPDGAHPGVRPVGAARHRGRARFRRRRRHPARRAGPRRRGRRPPLRRRPAQRLVGARPAGLGVRAARAVPRQVLRDLDLAVGRHDSTRCGRPGCPCPGRTPSRLPYLRGEASDDGAGTAYGLDVHVEVDWNGTVVVPAGVPRHVLVTGPDARAPDRQRRHAAQRRPVRVGHDLGAGEGAPAGASSS